MVQLLKPNFDNVKDRTVLILSQKKKKTFKKKEWAQTKTFKNTNHKNFSKDGKIIDEAKVNVAKKQLQRNNQEKTAPKELSKKSS